jgi:hypothetical protein
MGVETPFGGKVVILGGDFRQCLPIVKRGGRSSIVDAMMRRAKVWAHATEFELTENMRVLTCADGEREELNEWASYLLEAGGGTLEAPLHPETPFDVTLRPDLCVEAPAADSIGATNPLYDFVYPDIETGCQAAIDEVGRQEVVEEGEATQRFFARRAILAPYNVDVAAINDELLDRFPGQLCASTTAFAPPRAVRHAIVLKRPPNNYRSGATPNPP